MARYAGIAGPTGSAGEPQFPSRDYPDDWYQGEVSFTDRIMKFNTSNTEPVETDLFAEPVDATKLQIEGDYLFFVDKKTSYLWAKRISE